MTREGTCHKGIQRARTRELVPSSSPYHSRDLALCEQWTYGAHQGCLQGWGLACYFEPHAPQCPHLAARELPDDISATSVLREEDPGWMWERRDAVSGRGQCAHYFSNVADNPPWEYRQQGILWWRAQLLSFLMNPNGVLERRVRHVKNIIGFSHPIVGLHIRHGDACAHASLRYAKEPCMYAKEPCMSRKSHMHPEKAHTEPNVCEPLARLSNYRPPCKSVDDYFLQV